MLLPPSELDDARLLAELAEQHGVSQQRAEFVPVGEDSWCYRVGHLWVSLRRDLEGHVPAAYETANRLRHAGLDFVLAPLEGADGRVVRSVCGFPLVVFPFVAAAPITAETVSRRDLDLVVKMLDRVHEAVDCEGLPTETYVSWFEEKLDGLLERAAGQFSASGPYRTRLNRLIRKHYSAIATTQSELRRLASRCSALDQTPVLTHGEPRAANILRKGDRLLLADWGGAMLAPPERDWFHVISTLSAAPPYRPQFLRFYQLRWVLSEVAEYSARFINSHTGDADDEAMWGRLTQYLPE